MTFDLRDPNVMQAIIEAANPNNFDFREHYFLAASHHTYPITESVRTLTIFAISLGCDLYTEFFQDWNIMAKSPITFYRSNMTIMFCDNWTVQVRFGRKKKIVLDVSKPDTYTNLKEYLHLSS